MIRLARTLIGALIGLILALLGTLAIPSQATGQVSGHSETYTYDCAHALAISVTAVSERVPPLSRISAQRHRVVARLAAVSEADRATGAPSSLSAPVTRGQARAIEQALIVRNPGFNNKINSISPTHSYYDDAASWGDLG